MKKLFFILIFTTLLFQLSSFGQNVRVAAAANLRYVLDTIKAVYVQQHPHTTIDVTYGSSGLLVQQILNGAQFNLFMSADRTFPEKLKNAGAASGDVRTYAYGKLVLWSNVVSTEKGIQTVALSSVKKIAIAKPELAPYGNCAIQALKYFNLYDSVKNKIVYADNISQTAQFATSGNAELGFLALSLTFAPEMKSGNFCLIASTSYPQIDQACVLVKTWERNPSASDFMDFLSTPECRQLFENFGYGVPKQ